MVTQRKTASDNADDACIQFGHKTKLKAEYEILDAEWLVLWPVVFNGVILRLYDVQTVPGPQAIFRQFPSFPSNFQGNIPEI